MPSLFFALLNPPKLTVSPRSLRHDIAGYSRLMGLDEEPDQYLAEPRLKSILATRAYASGDARFDSAVRKTGSPGIA